MTMKDMLSTRDFSKISGIEPTTLRYWDSIGLFLPAVRDDNSNYRYYAPEQVTSVNFISVLRELNIPLKAIAQVSEGRTPESILDLIDEQEKILNKEMYKLREKYAVILARRDLINQGGDGQKALDGDTTVFNASNRYAEPSIPQEGLAIGFMHLEEMAYILGPRNHFLVEAEFHNSIMAFYQNANKYRINLSLPIGGFHEGLGSFKLGPGSPDYFFSYDVTGNKIRSAGDYLVGYTRGYYGQFNDLPGYMFSYAEAHGIELKGPVFSIYLHDEVCMEDHSQYLSKVSIPIES